MTSVLCEIITCLMLLTAVRGTSVRAKQIICVDKVNGTLDQSFLENRAEFSSVEVTADGVKLHNSTLVVVRPKCKCKELHNQQLLHLMINSVLPGSSLIPPQMAHADVEMTFMIQSDVITQQERHLYLTATA